MIFEPTTTEPISNRDSERGAALIMALLVSVILVFLGMGLLLQTSLGLQASGTDRWVAKAMYAADAGVMLQIQMIQSGALGSPASFVLQDSPDLDGFLKGEYTVTVSDYCEIRPATDLLVKDSLWSSEYVVRHFHFRSDAVRTIGNLGGMSRAAVAADVSTWPYVDDQLVRVTQCRGPELGS
jgi:Tfp pilus assembly protein PilX